MPLDRVNGELVPAFGPHDMPIPPNSRWRDTKYFSGARQHAVMVFQKEAKINRVGLNPRINDDDWFAQTYHRLGMIIFFFQKLIPVRKNRVFSEAVIQEKFHAVPTRIPIEELRDMTVTGMWPFVPEVLVHMPVKGRIDFLPLPPNVGGATRTASGLILP